jgi:retron-type reverse transcriptase
MTGAQIPEDVSPKLVKVAERAKSDPKAQFFSLAHLIDEAALERAYHRIRKDAAVGVDGVTKEEYGQKLEENIRNLHERMKTGRYRHQPIKREHIPKEGGRTRPIGISTVEDKVVSWTSHTAFVRDGEPMTLSVFWTGLGRLAR